VSDVHIQHFPLRMTTCNVDDILRGDLDLRLSCPHAELQNKRCSESMRRAMMSASSDPWSIAGASRMHGPISLCLRSWATVTTSAAKVPKWHHWAMPLGLLQVQQTGSFPPHFFALSPHQATAAVEELADSPRGQGSLLKPSDVWNVMIHLEVTSTSLLLETHQQPSATGRGQKVFHSLLDVSVSGSWGLAWIHVIRS
jgi:hypothetical protein